MLDTNHQKSFDKFKHKVPMLSLSNAFDKNDLINFEKILNYLNQNIKIEYSVEPKIDGISASLTYKNKNFNMVYLEEMEKLVKLSLKI